MSTRVLIVDDSVVARQALGRLIARHPDIEVLRPAADGQLALARIESDHPDVVILDVEMPVMNGLETLGEIRRRWATLPVIMFSSLTEGGAATTIEALALGASDYLAKPGTTSDGRRTLECVAEELVTKIHALGPVLKPAAPPPVPASAMPARPHTRRRAAADDRVDALVIGCSTGGPNALAAVLPRLPADFPVPILVVQHMPATFTRHLAERLDRQCQLKVREASAGQRVDPGEIALAPGDYHMLVRQSAGSAIVDLTQTDKVQSCRPAVDPLFTSAAAAFGSGLLGLVMTGMGRDGLDGAAAIHAAGGRVLVQDHATSVVWGMPGCIAEAGLADAILPLEQIPEHLIAACSQTSAPTRP